MHRHTRGTIFYHKGRCRQFRARCISCASRSAKVVRACACGWTASGLLGCGVVVLVTRDAAGSGSGPALGYFGLQQLLNAIIKQNTRYLLDLERLSVESSTCGMQIRPHVLASASWLEQPGWPAQTLTPPCAHLPASIPHVMLAQCCAARGAQYARRFLLIRRATTRPSCAQSNVMAPPSCVATVRCTNLLPKPSGIEGATTGGPPRSVHMTTTSSS